MMHVYELFRGTLAPQDVLKAALADDLTEQQRRPRLFYAHLYLGLYADVTGDRKKAAEHLALAAGKYRINHYMGEVARVHHELLTKKKQPGAPGAKTARRPVVIRSTPSGPRRCIAGPRPGT